MHFLSEEEKGSKALNGDSLLWLFKGLLFVLLDWAK